MLSDEILNMIFSDDRMDGIPLSVQSTVVRVVSDAIDKRVREMPYVTVEEIEREVIG